MKVLFVVGPTGTGKSQFSHMASLATGAHILNADSLQFYSSLDIGTAKPSRQQMQEVPHHLFDIAPIGSSLTAGDYRRLALETLSRLNNSAVPLAIVVGGSGFYLQALEKGMYNFGKVSEDIHLSTEKQAKEDLSALYEELQRSDPAYAQKIGPHDRYRISRAVELLRMFGKSPTQLRAEFKPEAFPYPLMKIGFEMSRDRLLLRIVERTRGMLQAGLVEEVRSVLQVAGAGWLPLQSIGYREVIMYLEGHLPEEGLEDEIVKNTMRLAKRQMTWFRRDSEIQWYDPDQGFDGPLNELQVRLRL